jgi:hypothetical protein
MSKRASLTVCLVSSKRFADMIILIIIHTALIVITLGYSIWRLRNPGRAIFIMDILTLAVYAITSAIVLFIFFSVTRT